MKKVRYLLLFMALLLLFTGCSSKKEEKKTKKKEVVDETLVTINGLKFHMDKKTSFEGINYTTVSDFQESTFSRYVQYRYSQEDGSNLLFYRVFFYKDQDNEVAKKDLGIDEKLEFKDGKTKNFEYKMIENPRNDGVIHFYFINKDNSTYVINLVSKYDIKDFEKKVLESLHF